MLKKTGIIVSVTAAAVLGVGGFAFATTPHHSAPSTITNVSDDNTGNNCDFGQAGPLVDQHVTGGDSTVGPAGLVTGTVAPITDQTQTLNCTNVVTSDESNTDSNNDTHTHTETVTDGSNNVDG